MSVNLKSLLKAGDFRTVLNMLGYELRKWTPAPGWSSSRRPRIAMTLMCKDEADIMRQYLAYHLPKVDMLIVTDNGSTDGTREILESFKSERLIIIDDPSAYANGQVPLMDRMICMARDRGADWVLVSDSDEFWVGDFHAVAMAYRRRWYSRLWAESWRVRPCAAEDPAEPDPVARMLWRERTPDKIYRKVFHDTARYLKIELGNHRVAVRGGRKAVTRPEEMRIYHYQWRSFAQFLRKCIEGARAYEGSGLPADKGSHYKHVYGIWKARGEEGVREMYDREIYVPESGMGELVRDDTVAAAMKLANSPASAK